MKFTIIPFSNCYELLFTKIPIIRNFCLRVLFEILFFRKKEKFYFIQIGSNDGKRNDPIYKFVEAHKFRGILVEPVREMFERLKKTYQYRANLIYENVAISDRCEQRKFYRLKRMVKKPEGWPDWYDQLGSFNKEILMKESDRIDDLEKNIVSHPVQCITLHALFEKHSVHHVDLFHIDTEGYDYEIIKQLLKTKIRPKVILYEHKHLTKKDMGFAIAELEHSDYTVKRLDFRDTICIYRGRT